MTEANASPPPGGDEQVGAGVRWEVHALALGRVVRATGWPESTAAEWLRQQALGGTLRVRFRPTWIAATDDNKRRDGLRHMYPERVEDGGDISECVWCTPIDDFRAIGPPAMGEYWMQFLEWDADELSAALAEWRTEAEGEEQQARGRRPDWPWAEIVAEVAIWFALNGGRDPAEVVTAKVQEIAKRLHSKHAQPSRSSAQRYAEIVRAAWERRKAAARK